MRRFITKFRKSFRHGEKGFTLIELLIVVALLGLLMAVVIPNVATFMRSGEKAAAQAELSSVQTAVFAMMADKGFGSITGGTVHATQDLTATDEQITSFLGAGLTKLDGEWVVFTDGYITSGTYKKDATHKWTYTSGATPEWAYA